MDYPAFPYRSSPHPIHRVQKMRILAFLVLATESFNLLSREARKFGIFRFWDQADSNLEHPGLSLWTVDDVVNFYLCFSNDLPISYYNEVPE